MLNISSVLIPSFSSIFLLIEKFAKSWLPYPNAVKDHTEGTSTPPNIHKYNPNSKSRISIIRTNLNWKVVRWRKDFFSFLCEKNKQAFDFK